MNPLLVALQLKFESSALLALELNSNLKIDETDEYNRNALHYISLYNFVNLCPLIKNLDELNKVVDVNGETPSDICLRLNHDELFDIINFKKHILLKQQIISNWS